MRAQLISLDFLFSLLLITLVIGLSVQYNETIQKTLAANLETSSKPELFAQAILGEGNAPLPADGYCAEYYDQSRTAVKTVVSCTGFACDKNVYTTTRLAECPTAPGSACSLLVKTCV